MKFYVFLGVLVLSITLQARNQFLVLSGGNDPAANHNSQYLQTQALYEHMRSLYGNDVSVYFGAGNRPDRPIVVHDVHKAQFDFSVGGDLSIMVPGVINNNQPATMENVMGYFDTLKERSLTSNDTLFLLVSDHGMPSNSDYSNNCINLWGFDVTGSNAWQVRPFDKNCLTRKQLQQTLATTSPAKRTVFAMSQCFSGGFHQMSVSYSGGFPTANTAVCGFSAVTEDALASGCTPNADGPSYQGYERSLTEHISGVDFVRKTRIRAPKSSLLEAHEAATLEDLTTDIPLKTSEYYLMNWAKTSMRTDFKSRTLIAADVGRKAFNHVANSNVPFMGNSLPKDMSEALGKRYPKIASLLMEGNATDLMQARQTLLNEQNLIARRLNAISKRAHEIRATIFKVWFKTLKSENAMPLTDLERQIESKFLSIVEFQSQHRPGWQYTLRQVALRDLSLRYLHEPEKSSAVSKLLASRDKRMAAWAGRQSSELKALTDEYAQLEKEENELGEKYQEADTYVGLIRRISIYRMINGAEAMLFALQDTKALNELKGLRECEATPF